MSDQKYSDDDLRRVAGIKDELFNDRPKVILEMLADMQSKVAKIPKMEADIAELGQDMKVVKAAVTDVSRQVNDHQHRIAHLQTSS